MNTKEFVKQIQTNKIDATEHIKEVFEKLHRINKEYNYFNVLDEQKAISESKKINTKGKLAGVPISVKDNICVKGMESTATSRILKGYKPPFDATAVELLRKEGAIIIGKTSNDAFGFGSFNTNIGLDYSVPKNPVDKERSCGGSSGSSAGLTRKASFVHLGLAESTGGSIECPAAFCGVVGFCPTYSAVSRYGLMDYASSLDKIGTMTKTVSDAELMMEVISRYDPKDSTSSNITPKKIASGKLKVGIINETLGNGTNSKIVKEFYDTLERSGINGTEINLPLVNKHALSTYYVLAMSEASTNLAKYCGLRYGQHEKLTGTFNEYFSSVRTKHFNSESKRRIMLGTFTRMRGYRDAYYIQAAKIRTLIIQEYMKQFKKIDLLLCPTMPIISPKLKDIEKLTPIEHYMMDTITVGPNLAGLPHLSIPMKDVDSMPSGMMIIGNHFDEQKVLKIGREIENGTT